MYGRPSQQTRTWLVERVITSGRNLLKTISCSFHLVKSLHYLQKIDMSRGVFLTGKQMAFQKILSANDIKCSTNESRYF